MTPNLHLWIIPILPLAGAAINGLLGKRFSRQAVAAVALGFCFAAFAMALWIVAQFSSLTLPHLDPPLASWLRSGDFNVNFSFAIDQLSLVMLLVVTGVGFLIHIYSVGYMWEEGGYYRFFSYLNLFMFFMLTLVLASNYLVMFVGWEGVGLASYLLIGFWFTKESAAAAGKKAFIVNRIGDFGFLIALFLMITQFKSLDFSHVFGLITQHPQQYSVEASGAGVLTAIALLLMVGACGKSAQIPLYVWLPDAMEGPTPVSALIHAATMVTAGVYMVARSHLIFERAPSALTVVAIIGTLTAFFAATIGIAQTDIKKVLAYSTISQLGYMFLACGVAAFSAGIFHLMTHAFFKGLLFLAAGSVIHAVGGEQDMRKMGGLWRTIPWTFGTMTIATIAIAGIPPFAGFFSKDEILWRAYQANWIYWLVGLVTAFITSFYMFRLWFMTFFGEYRGEAEASHGHGMAGEVPAPPGHGHGHGGIHESPKVMLVPLVILAVLSFVGGWIGIHHHFDNFLVPVFQSSAIAATTFEGGAATRGDEEGPGLETTLMVVSVAAGILGFLLAFLLYNRKPELPARIAASVHGLYTAVANKYWIDELYAWIFVKPLIAISGVVFWRGIDQGVIDATLDGSADTAREVSDNLRHMQSGNLRSYAGWVAIGATAVIIYMVWVGLRTP
ncbi:MAG: NADH-quinone oxidoreductase subunit L [Acidobacteria bacterium]|nr:MAG: NADH-quinone oxidoreductase subunit L [Acidobacteriota bacterium]PYV71300.1 MAG: NADH-quinone oxidoreductase subunit L [Acidobacteriota bacterium]